MKKLKRAFFLGIWSSVLLTAVLAFPSPKGIEFPTFANIVTTDLFSKKLGDTTSASFEGIYDETIVNLDTSRINMGMDVVFGLGTKSDSRYFNSEEYNYSYTSINWVGVKDWFAAGIKDWYIEFAPVREVTSFLHDRIYLPGAYLTVANDYFSSKNAGSDMGGVLSPTEGFLISAGIDFPSDFGHDDWEPCINAGISYSVKNIGGVGLCVRNIATIERVVGVSGTFIGLNGLTVNAGFTYNEKDGLFPLGYSEYCMKGNLFSLSLNYNYSFFTVKSDFVINAFSSEKGLYDIYIGLLTDFQLNSNFLLTLEGRIISDFSAENDPFVYFVKPGISFKYFKTYEANLSVQFFVKNNEVYLNLPIYWKYSY